MLKISQRGILDMKTDMYYDPNKMLSYNRILNFVVGARGIGKTFSMKKYVINRFLKNDEQFVYVRRYQTELKKVKTFFDDIKFLYPDVDFAVKGRELWINEKLAGFAVPLSTYQNEKSNAYPRVTTIVFDEFIREDGMYIRSVVEPESLLSLMDTVFRSRDNARCICLSNSITIVNPYFLYFNIVPDISKRFNSNDSIVVEIPRLDVFKKNRLQTRFGKLIQETDYGEMAVDNVFTGDSKVFLEKRTPDSRFQFSIMYNGMVFGIWVDVGLGLMYISQATDPSTRFHYAMTTKDMEYNTLLGSNWKKNYHLYKMVGAFKKGYLRFDNQVIRNTMYDLFKKMNIH